MVRLQLLRTMARHGSPERKEKLVKFAIGEGRPTLQRLTAKALFVESDSFLQVHHSLVDDATIGGSQPECLHLVMSAHVERRTYRSLVASRSVARVQSKSKMYLCALLYVFYSGQREEAAQEEIGRYLSEEVRGTLKQFPETGSIDDLSGLDELGDVRSVELIKDSLKSWFKPNGKNGKEKK